MLKRLILFWMVTTLFLLTSCGTTAPKDTYASAMQPALEKLAAWEKVNADLEGLLNESLDSQSGMTRLDMIELYNMATGYKITRDDYSKLGFVPLDMLVGDATKIAQEGHAIENILSAATPVQDVQASHQAILECVKARVAFSEGMVNSIKNLSPIDLSADASSCSTFESDMQKLTAYVNEHK